MSPSASPGFFSVAFHWFPKSILDASVFAAPIQRFSVHTVAALAWEQLTENSVEHYSSDTNTSKNHSEVSGCFCRLLHWNNCTSAMKLCKCSITISTYLRNRAQSHKPNKIFNINRDLSRKKCDCSQKAFYSLLAIISYHAMVHDCFICIWAHMACVIGTHRLVPCVSPPPIHTHTQYVDSANLCSHSPRAAQYNHHFWRTRYWSRCGMQYLHRSWISFGGF